MKYLKLIIAVFVLFAASPSYGFMHFALGGMSFAPSGTCDDCSGSLAYSHHAENNDDATTETNGTCGCSDSDTYKSWDLTTGTTNATYSSTYKNDGLYSVLLDGTDDSVVVTETDWLDITSIGTWEGYVRLDAGSDGWVFYFDAGATWFRADAETGNNIKITINDGTFKTLITTTATLTDDTFTYVRICWDFSDTGGGADIIRVKIGAQTEETVTNLTVSPFATPNDVTYYVMGGAAGSMLGYIDSVKLYESDEGN